MNEVDRDGQHSGEQRTLYEKRYFWYAGTEMGDAQVGG